MTDQVLHIPANHIAITHNSMQNDIIIAGA